LPAFSAWQSPTSRLSSAPCRPISSVSLHSGSHCLRVKNWATCIRIKQWHASFFCITRGRSFIVNKTYHCTKHLNLESYQQAKHFLQWGAHTASATSITSCPSSSMVPCFLGFLYGLNKITS
jgi:hypothetical protein